MKWGCGYVVSDSVERPAHRCDELHGGTLTLTRSDQRKERTIELSQRSRRSFQAAKNFDVLIFLFALRSVRARNYSEVCGRAATGGSFPPGQA